MSALHLLYQGQQFTIVAFGEDDGTCEVEEFLNNRQKLSASDEARLQDLFIRHGDHGPIRDSTKCKLLDDRIWEYKAREGGRVAWFYEPGSLVVCACAVAKEKAREQIQSSSAVRR